MFWDCPEIIESVLKSSNFPKISDNHFQNSSIILFTAKSVSKYPLSWNMIRLFGEKFQTKFEFVSNITKSGIRQLIKKILEFRSKIVKLVSVFSVFMWSTYPWICSKNAKSLSYTENSRIMSKCQNIRVNKFLIFWNLFQQVKKSF